jgi:hypothetical protein
MIQKKIQTQNSLADFNNLDKSHLSIQLSLDGFAFCVFDKDLVDVVLLNVFEFENRSQTPEQLLDNVKEVFDTEPILSRKFNSINVSHKNNLSTLVPVELYDKGKHAEYLKYTIKVLESDSISVDDLKENDSNNVYIPFKNINDFLIEKLGGFDYIHASSILISGLLKYYKHNLHKHFFVNVSKNSFDIVYIDNNKVQFHNSFLYYTKEDFLYYILFAMEQLMLNPDEQTLTFLGAINKNSPLYDITYTYVRNINFLKVENFSLSEEFYLMNPHIEKHQLFELLNQF